jgi:hypothetical protein
MLTVRVRPTGYRHTSQAWEASIRPPGASKRHGLGPTPNTAIGCLIGIYPEFFDTRHAGSWGPTGETARREPGLFGISSFEWRDRNGRKPIPEPPIEEPEVIEPPTMRLSLPSGQARPRPRAPIEVLIDSAMRCLKCGAPMGGCDCWGAEGP